MNARKRIIRKAAKLIRLDAEMEYESNADPDGFVNDRTAWRSIKMRRKLAKRLRALAA